MMKPFCKLLFVLSFLCMHSLCAQQAPDSLMHLIASAKEDTAKVKLLQKMFTKTEYTDDAKAEMYLKQALMLSHKLNDAKSIASTYTLLGYLAEDRGNYQSALKYYSASLAILKVHNMKHDQPDDDKGISAAYVNIGNVYSVQGNYSMALSNYFAALKLKENLGDKSGEASCYNAIALVYQDQGNYNEALKNHFISLRLKEALGDEKGIAGSHNNIGAAFSAQGNYEEALKNYLISLKIKQKRGDQRGIASCYNNIGIVYFLEAGTGSSPGSSGMLNNALKNYFASLEIKKSTGDMSGITGSYCNIGLALTKQKNYPEALKYLSLAKDAAMKYGQKQWLKNTYNGLASLDSAMGNFKGAFENHKLYARYSDSLDNEEMRKKTLQSEMNYEFDKKQAVADAEHKKEVENIQLLSDEQAEKQKAMLLLVSCVLVIVIGFAVFVFRSLSFTREQKEIIEQQKMIVEEHQKDIIASITYAKRIQQAQLPSESYISRSLARLKNGNMQ